MAESPANRSRIVPIMADEALSKPKSTTRKSAPIPRPAAPSRISTRSRTKSYGLDGVDGNLKILEERGLYVAKTPGDGNCLFYALSDQMYGTMERAFEIREALAVHMSTHEEYFGAFAVPEESERRSARVAARRTESPFPATPSPTVNDKQDAFTDMVSRCATPAVWGGGVEIQAFCQYYQRDVRVYSPDNVQNFRAWDAPNDEVREVVHLAYINGVHYSSVRNIDGPHEGLPNVKPKAVVIDIESPQAWKISHIQNGLSGQYDQDTIVSMLRRCRGDINRAFARLLDEESSSTSSFVSSATSAASSQATTASTPEQQQNANELRNETTATPMVNFKPHLMSSRSSSRHSTASKRSADDSDDEGSVLSAQRGREQKRRILPKVTVGINFGDHDQPDMVSLRWRVDSDVVAEQVTATPSSLKQSEQPKSELEQPKPTSEQDKPNAKPKKTQTKAKVKPKSRAEQGQCRKLRPRKPRSSVTSELDTALTLSDESSVKLAE
ncbi:extracellular OTU-like cysteine protease, putative [Talaromyces stipitatus ATCC 10500]|uniref:Extracellular OTU-like cysteine protease, putative n=1 Tax=Talaromyces stipitatus (strain ATCC 10500 / CBS 375.48 / QM 6759 / NRRL 1006) TaxID=441959 RepID=B8LT05_TALSN|nr:extracellular OTU-like cysteine protease, putative [Talaromyces stipitatus ATCC 10500]EED23001.1 extracellular OTU-like cysteine protease, putative [Talaromyces stipitatus ATCC 10500]